MHTQNDTNLSEMTKVQLVGKQDDLTVVHHGGVLQDGGCCQEGGVVSDGIQDKQYVLRSKGDRLSTHGNKECIIRMSHLGVRVQHLHAHLPPRYVHQLVVQRG